MLDEMLADELMTTAQVAEYTKIAVSTLQMYRTYGTGPKFVKIRKRLVRYRKYEVDVWLDEMQRSHTAQTYMQRIDREMKQMEHDFDRSLNTKY